MEFIIINTWDPFPLKIEFRVSDFRERLRALCASVFARADGLAPEMKRLCPAESQVLSRARRTAPRLQRAEKQKGHRRTSLSLVRSLARPALTRDRGAKKPHNSPCATVLERGQSRELDGNLACAGAAKMV